jgi:hypothetical protein
MANVVILDAAIVDAVRDDPVRVEKDVSENPGTLRLDALIVETVSVELITPKLLLIDDAAIVDAVRDDPVSVEKDVRENPGTLRVDALIVETVSVEFTVAKSTTLEVALTKYELT